MLVITVRCARLRIERCIDRGGSSAQAGHHLLQHVIAADAQPVADDLHIGVAVAEMPSQLHQRERRPRRDLDQRLGLPYHQHDPAIVEHDAVAVAQRDGLVQIQQKLGPMLALEHDAAAMPVACIEHDEIDGDHGVPEACTANGPAALHACLGSAHNGAGKINRDTIMSKPSTIQGKYSAAGEGNIYARANVATCKITANDTDGTFEIFDEQCKPGFESRLHMHTKSFQVCYVVDGAGEFQLGEEVFHAKKGACVNIPPGVPHKVGSKAGMRMLMVYSPPGLEGMMKAMKALSPEHLADGALTSRILAEHDTVVLGEGAGSKGSGSVLG
jgi:mannose-6-phosphate isomerase-like protein (cupin superfamily)